MKVRFWGTRGSIAKSSSEVLKYGGNTSCVEIRSEANDLIILDAGTGLHGLSHQLLQEKVQLRSASILISHTHWDHIQGLPFFAPFFFPNVEWHIYGPPTLSHDLKSILSGQMQKVYFPITQDIFNAQIKYHNLTEGEFSIGDIHVKTQYLNHPGVTMGYRITVDGHTIVYSTDHEPHDCRLAHGGHAHKNTEDGFHAQLLEGADYVIHDTQYLASEYEQRRGWGHSTMEYVVDLSHQADVKRLILFHHDPMRSDHEVDQIVDMSRERARNKAGKMEIWAASENQPLWVPPKIILPSAYHNKLVSQAIRPDERASSIIDELHQVKQNIICLGLQHYDQAINMSGHYSRCLNQFDRLDHASSDLSTSLIFIAPSALEAPEVINDLVKIQKQPPQIVLFCKADECTSPELSKQFPGLIRMVEPVSDIYLSSRIETWLRRQKKTRRWKRAQISSDETLRQREVNKVIGLMKTEAIKHRVNQLCHFFWQGMTLSSHGESAVAFNIITMSEQISLVNYPATVSSQSVSCSRDESICAHVIEQGSIIATSIFSPDGLLGNYAEYTGAEQSDMIRTYIGKPISLNGQVIATLCFFSKLDIVLTKNHKQLLSSAVKLIEDVLSSSRYI
ncbi:MAG: hypothetical protein CMH49_07390 [Myxococcales bacterium]|nr:hypothetical protein [Myxococcales bacterium]